MSSKPDEHWINVLLQLAQDIPRDESSHRAKHAACIVYRGRSAGFGFNSMKTSPFQARFKKNPHAIYIHSEIMAIKQSMRTLSLRELSRSTLYVARIKQHPVTKQIVQGMSCPCAGCTRAIIEFGIKRVVYTLDDTGLVCT